jgi:hypothetical protein
VRAVLLMSALLVLAACAEQPRSGGTAQQPGRTGETAMSPDETSIAENDLQVTFDPGDGTESSVWTLTCGEPVEGTHPEVAAVCAHLRTLEHPFAPLPPDVICTEQYGGPQTAHVLGRWDGQPVDLELSRVDGCRISQWDALVPLVPAAPVGELPR